MEKLIRVAFLSTYPPRECGIATFTQDLFRELQKNCGLQTGIIAVNDQDYVYGKDVIQEFPQQDRASYTKLADWVNRSAIQVIVIEHEYGIYGGECGEYLLDFAERVQKPFVLTLHTVLPNPSEKQKQILQELCKKSSRIVTMASNSQKILCNLYGTDPEKITVIPHGVPVFEVPSREELKKQQNLEGRTIVSTFGLISSGKGLEYGIRAIADVAEKHPDILYLILGQTHPVVKKREGEAYRESLEKLVDDLGSAAECSICKPVSGKGRTGSVSENVRYLYDTLSWKRAGRQRHTGLCCRIWKSDCIDSLFVRGRDAL